MMLEKYERVMFGGLVSLVGMGMFFFDQTKDYALLPLLFGIGYIGGVLKS